MKTLNRRDFPGAQYPERIIQFGEGNFLRAFVDWQIDLLNEHTDLNSGVVVVRPIETSFPPSLSTQDGLYTTIIRGLNEKGEAVSDARLIRSVNREISVYSEYDEFLKLAHNPEMRFVFSNTTEAGISYHAGDKFDDAPAVSYPAKLTRLLFERFSHFNGAQDKGWIIIPCELIDYNGDALRELVLRYAQEWALPEAFIQWLDQANSFCSTLVDRIVTGYPRDEVAKLEEELGYHDGFLDTAEHFYLFVIQGPKSLATELRLDKYPLNVLIVDDIKPYKERKVAILNGAHTALVPVAFQAGLDTVGEAMNDAEICAFVEKAIYEEIIPVLDLPRDELESFASAVTGRFRNPYIKHQLLSIALNGMTKFRTRILPQLLAGQKANGTLPARLTFALAALIAFYRGERNGETYPVQDDAHWLERYQQLWSQHRDRVIGTQELILASTNSAGDYTLTNALKGDGLMRVQLSSSDKIFGFTHATGTEFAGVAQLKDSTFTLERDNTAALTHAMLQSDSENTTSVKVGEQSIGGLAMNGGTLIFDTDIPAATLAEGYISVDTLVVGAGDYTWKGRNYQVNGTGDVLIDVPKPWNDPMANNPLTTLNLLEHDDSHVGVQLVKAQTVIGSGGSLTLRDLQGDEVEADKTLHIAQNGTVVAEGDYGFRLTTAPGDGLYVNYGLKALNIHGGQKLTLAEHGGAYGATADMSAKIGGEGDLAINTVRQVSLSNGQNDYQGATYVQMGTLRTDADGALGNTRELNISNAAIVDLNGSAQTVETFTGLMGSTVLFKEGSLTVNKGGISQGELTGGGNLNVTGGTLAIEGLNARYNALTSISPNAEVSLDNTQGLGRGNIASDGLLTLKNVTGELNEVSQRRAHL